MLLVAPRPKTALDERSAACRRVEPGLQRHVRHSRRHRNYVSQCFHKFRFTADVNGFVHFHPGWPSSKIRTHLIVGLVKPELIELREATRASAHHSLLLGDNTRFESVSPAHDPLLASNDGLFSLQPSSPVPSSPCHWNQILRTGNPWGYVQPLLSSDPLECASAFGCRLLSWRILPESPFSSIQLHNTPLSPPGELSCLGHMLLAREGKKVDLC